MSDQEDKLKTFLSKHDDESILSPPSNEWNQILENLSPLTRQNIFVFGAIITACLMVTSYLFLKPTYQTNTLDQDTAQFLIDSYAYFDNGSSDNTSDYMSLID